jgi:hypothetical protein
VSNWQVCYIKGIKVGKITRSHLLLKFWLTAHKEKKLLLTYLPQAYSPLERSNLSGVYFITPCSLE